MKKLNKTNSLAMIKLQQSTYYPKLLSVLLLCYFFTTNITAQDDPCEEAGYYLSFAPTAPDCYGEATGNITVASNGCSCMFSGCTFTWSNGADFHTVIDLEAGEYSVVITHPNGCVLTGSAVVPEAEQYIESFEKSDILCKGDASGSLKVIPMPNFYGLLTYEWSNGATTQEVHDLPAGEYTVTVSQFNGCSMTETFIVEEPEEALSMDVQSSPSCANISNGIIDLTVIGGVPPYTYFCDNEARPSARMENLQSGMHSVRVSDANQCEIIVEVEVATIETESIDITTSVDNICEGEAANLFAFTSSSNLTYKWEPTESIVSSSNSNVIIVTPNETTTYTLTTINAEGCESTSTAIITVENCEEEENNNQEEEEEEEEEEEPINTSIEEVAESVHFNAYPNPSRQYIYFDYDAALLKNSSIRVIDLSGRTVLSSSQIPNRLDLGNIQSGVYFLQLQNKDYPIIQKIVKE